MADADGITKLVELIKDIKITMFTTIDGDGHFVSRPMAQQHAPTWRGLSPWPTPTASRSLSN